RKLHGSIKNHGKRGKTLNQTEGKYHLRRYCFRKNIKKGRKSFQEFPLIKNTVRNFLLGSRETHDRVPYENGQEELEKELV
ncbi:hypothetical protein AKJ41_06345, partial [candidate division MSBL1 archaeon SCGC-AAA259O05]